MMQQTEYGRYEGENQYSEFAGVQGQKIRDDSDEQFADILTRKIKGELRQEKDTLVSQRLMLGIVSICAVVILFGFLMVALVMGVTKGNEGGSIGLGWGFIAACWVLVCVNVFF